MSSRRGLPVVLVAVALVTAGPAGLFGSGGAAHPASRAMACSPGTTVTTDDGPVCGLAGPELTSWLGIRYAAPPVGALRWAPPRRPAAWTAPFPATAEGSICPQPSGAGLPGSTDEDCLNLDVRAPATTARRPLPVMVQIHGGGFRLLGPSDAGHLVTAGQVVGVELNYRLGILGFLAHQAFGTHAGDYALQDQQAALRWVRRNIARFGGDPGNVTIYGASAGGSSVCDQTVSPSAAGLFQRGISESGQYNSLLGVNTQWQAQDCKAALPTEDQAQRAGARFAAAVGCGAAPDAAACLRGVPVPTLLTQAGDGLGPDSGTLAPIVNGTTLPLSPGEAFAAGRLNHVTLMIGVARDETQLPSAETTADYDRLVAQQYGEHAPAVRAAYPPSRFPAPQAFLAYRTIVADSNSVCPAVWADRALSRHIPVYAYELDDSDAPPLFFLDPTKPNGSYHVDEIPLLFPGSATLDPDQRALSDQLTAEWTGFARTGDPTVDGAPAWEPFTADNPVVMSLNAAGDSQLTTEIPRQHHCDQLWSGVAPDRR